MSGRRGLLLAGAAAVLVVAPAGAAPSAHTFPKLLVRDTGRSVTIEITHDDLDDAAAKLTIFPPTGYRTSLGQPSGTRIGTVRALVTAPDLGLAKIVVSGDVEVRSESDTYSTGGEPVSLSAGAERCLGTATHAAFWVLILEGAGQVLELPLFVDIAPPNAASFASATIQACLPPPDVPPGMPGRAPFGFELARVVLTLNDVLRGAGAGERRWRMTETEYLPATDRPNPADTAETQALVYVGGSVTLGAPAMTIRRGVATLSFRGKGTIPAAAEPRYRLYRGRTRRSLHPSVALDATRSGLRGRLQVRQMRNAQTIYLQARGVVETLGLGPSFCRPTFRSAGTPCVYAIRTGVSVRSATLAVVVPSRR